MCGDWWDTYYNLLNGYALHGYVLVGYVWVGYVWNGYVWDMCDVLDMCGICVVDTFGMDMCGICVMCWICVGYVWCEIRKQSSEEPCDETSFGKKQNFLTNLVDISLLYDLEDISLAHPFIRSAWPTQENWAPWRVFVVGKPWVFAIKCHWLSPPGNKQTLKTKYCM